MSAGELGRPRTSDFEDARRRKEQVLRLDVAVDDVARVQVRQSAAERENHLRAHPTQKMQLIFPGRDSAHGASRRADWRDICTAPTPYSPREAANQTFL